MLPYRATVNKTPMASGSLLVAMLRELIADETSSLDTKWKFTFPPFKTWAEHRLFRRNYDVRQPGECINHIWKQNGFVYYSSTMSNGKERTSTFTEDDLDAALKHFVTEQADSNWPWLTENLKIQSLLPEHVRRTLVELRNVVNSERDASPIRARPKKGKR